MLKSLIINEIIKVAHKKRTYISFFLITILMLAFVFIGIGIKIILKKDGKFAGTCASQSPFLNKEGETCGFCGKTADEMCPNES